MGLCNQLSFVSLWTSVPESRPLTRSKSCGRPRPIRCWSLCSTPVMTTSPPNDESAVVPPSPPKTKGQPVFDSSPDPDSEDFEASSPGKKTKHYFGDEEFVEPIYLEQVPGKIVLNELQLAEQKKALDQYAELLRKDRLEMERKAARLFGFVPVAEKINGRFAMFFFVTGLLTEYWTGYSIPEQVELLLRTLGII